MISLDIQHFIRRKDFVVQGHQDIRDNYHQDNLSEKQEGVVHEKPRDVAQITCHHDGHHKIHAVCDEHSDNLRDYHIGFFAHTDLESSEKVDEIDRRQAINANHQEITFHDVNLVKHHVDIVEPNVDKARQNRQKNDSAR